MNFAKTAFPMIGVLIFFAFPTALGLANTLLAVLLLTWLLRGNFKEDFENICSSPVIVCSLILYGVIVFGTFYSSAPSDDILLHLKKYSKLLIVPLLFCALKAPIWQRRCLLAFSAAMLFILISTWLNIWLFLPWSASQQLGWGASHHVFGDYITQNVMMAFFVLICLVVAYNENSTLRKIGLVAIAILAAISITHLSNGRTGYVLLAVALLTFILNQYQGKRRWFALVAIGLALTLVFSSSELIERRFDEAVKEAKHKDSDTSTSIGHRLYNYKTTALLIEDSPFFGRGTGAYHTQICPYVEEGKACEQFSWHPHNQFLFFGADQGLLGMMAYSALLISMVILAFKTKNSLSRPLLLGLAFLLFTNSLINSPLWSARESHFFLFMIALLSAMSHVIKDSDPP